MCVCVCVCIVISVYISVGAVPFDVNKIPILPMYFKVNLNAVCGKFLAIFNIQTNLHSCVLSFSMITLYTT